MTRSVVNYLNARGGIAGRQIELVIYDINIARAQQDPSSESQAAGSAFTEDNKVFAVSQLAGGVQPNFYQCLQKRRVVLSMVGEWTTQRLLQRYPSTVYQPVDSNYTRILANNVDALAHAGWFGTAPMIGVVGSDTPDNRSTVSEGLQPALARHGLGLQDQFYVSATDFSKAASDYQIAVLRFKSQGINRVLFAPLGSLLLFGNSAASGDYHPVYAVDSRLSPDFTAANVPADQLRGAMGMGWIPFADLNAAGWSEEPTPRKAECLAAVEDSGENLSSGLAMLAAVWICDGWFFLRDAAARASDLSYAGFQAAVESLGRDYRPASTFASHFAPRRLHDGAAAYKLNAFDDQCRCFRYVSGLRPMP